MTVAQLQYIKLKAKIAKKPIKLKEAVKAITIDIQPYGWKRWSHGNS